MARKKSAPRHQIESLEKRLLLSGINQNLGQLNGRFWTQGSVFDSAHSDEYHFTLAQAGTVDLQLSRMIGTGRMVLEQGKEFPLINFIASTKFSSNDQMLHESLAAGDYFVLVVADQGQLIPSAFYTLAIAPDFAPGAQFAHSSDYRTDTARNLGTLSEESDNHVNDFIGFLDTSAHPAGDLIDTYSFRVPARGDVNAVVGGLAADQANSGAKVYADLELYRDTNGDGRLQASEAIASDTTLGTGVAHTTPIALNPGQYFVVVSNLQPIATQAVGGTNYTLKFIYNAFDNAGNTLAGARSVSPASDPLIFNDYLSSLDTTDIYKFTTGTGGPFVFNANLTGVSSSDFDLQLVEDKNHNNAIDISNGEIINFSQNRGIADEHIQQILTTPDTYYLVVKRFFGEDAYTLTLSDRNTDIAGNSRATALNIGELAGQRTFSDSLGAADPDDFFQFTIPAFGSFKASFPATDPGTDANLQILNSTGAVILSSARTGNVGESVAAKATAGTYFARVFRAAGSPAYKLTLTMDTAGPTTGSARVLSIPGSTTEFVGADDTRDAFKVHVNSPQQLTVTLSNLTAAVDLSLAADANGNSQFDPSEITLLQTVSSPGGTFPANLSSAGDFYVLVDQSGSASANYTIALATATLDGAGNTLGTAAFAGQPGKHINSPFTDFVGSGSTPAANDPVDFYRLDVANEGGPFVLNAVMTQLSAAPNNAAFSLFRDDNNNGVLDSGEQLFGNTGSNLVKTISQTITVPGTYYLQVLRLNGNVNYTLSIAATSLDSAGNSFQAAKDLGSLTNSLQATEFVGAIDHDDFFKFNVAKAGEAAIHVTNPTDGSVIASIVQDVNHNGTFDPNTDTLGTMFSGTVLDGVVLPAAGNYFVHIIPRAGDVNYSFTLTFSQQTPFNAASFQITNTALSGTKIEAEDFDKGGQPDAYFDTTTGNDNGALRGNTNVDVKTTGDTGGGFRVTDTAVGEYMEYTINVQQAGNYDFDLRVASPAAGASCHIEIDGANVTGPVSIPNTGGFDAMTTVTKTSIPLTFGPHVMRLAMDAGTSTGFCGSYNFITVRPSITPGTFTIAPVGRVVDPNQDAKLSLTWTVPSGSWHLLTDIRLRLVSDDGTILAIKWNEAAKTFALWYHASGTYGPALSVGSNHVLSNSYMSVNLAGSGVTASGPTSPTVTLTFDLRFKKKLSGHTLTLLAAADDDLGRRGGFQAGGIWKVGN